MIVKNISGLCRQRNISIARLEKALCIGNGTIGRWEKSSPTVENLKKVADYFGVTVNDLISQTSASEST